MIRTIAVDGGNTKLKLGLLAQDFSSVQYVQEVNFETFNSAINELCHTFKISQIHLALTSVVQSTKEFILSFANTSPLVIDFHYVSAKDNHILNIIYDRQKLGSDRLAAAIAARHSIKDDEIIIIDSGTATKVDMIRGNVFLGGFIIPGIGIKAQALFEKTDKLPPTDVYNLTLESCPQETSSAIESGLIIDSLGGIEKAIEICKKTVPNARIIASGGGWDVIKAFSDNKTIRTLPNLALLGAGISMKLSKSL